MASPQNDDKFRELNNSINKLANGMQELVTLVTVIEARLQDSKDHLEEIRESIEDTKKLLNEIDKKVSLAQATNTNNTDGVKSIKDNLETKYVSKSEFEPIKKIVYTVSTVIMTGIVGALLKLVVHT